MWAHLRDSALALLHRHAYAQRAIDRADRLALPAPDCRMAAQEAADAPRTAPPVPCSRRPSARTARPAWPTKATGPFCGRTNCGRKARKNSADLGFSTSARIACRNAVRVDARGRRQVGEVGPFEEDAHAQVDQIGRAGVLDHVEQESGRHQDGRQPQHRHAGMDQVAGRDASPVAMPTRVPEVAARASVSSTAGPGISTKPVSTAR